MPSLEHPDRHFPPDPLHSTSADAADFRCFENARPAVELGLDRSLFFLVEPRPANWSAALGALGPGPGDAGVDTLDMSEPFLFGERGHHREHDVTDHFVVGRQHRFCVGVKADPSRGQPLQMSDRRHHALAREAVECPAQNNVELALVSIIEHSGEFRPFILAFAAAHAFDVLALDDVPGMGTPCPQLKQLIVGVLAMAAIVLVTVFCVGAHPSIDRNAHRARSHTVSVPLLYGAKPGFTSRISAAFRGNLLTRLLYSPQPDNSGQDAIQLLSSALVLRLVDQESGPPSYRRSLAGS